MGCLKTSSKYNILVRNKGLFIDSCKKVSSFKGIDTR